ncbi:hypothetical protein JTP77_023920 [Streptomyces sp. S9]|nr:hypothetical protein [Streptomyces sp. S9]
MAKQELQAWERVLVARAQGKDVDPEDLAEARAASRPGSLGWAARVAAQAAPKREPAPVGEGQFRRAVLERLGVTAQDDGPDAA